MAVDELNLTLLDHTASSVLSTLVGICSKGFVSGAKNMDMRNIYHYLNIVNGEVPPGF